MRAPRPVLFFRETLAEQGELEVARRYFPVIRRRSDVLALTQAEPLVEDPARGRDRGQVVVVPRYSALPFYRELEDDVEALGGKLINTYHQHQYVADLQEWYQDFEDLTPKTWFLPSDVPSDEPGAFVLKGATNSRKDKWATHMYAPERGRVGVILARLLDDPLIAQQRIYVRQYEPFVQLATSIVGAPVTKEYRFFILDGEVLAAGFYWSSHYDDIVKQQPAAVLNPPTGFVVREVIPRLRAAANAPRFVVADVAEREDGVWRLVELNCGTMSGLGMVDADVLYSRLWEALQA